MALWINEYESLSVIFTDHQGYLRLYVRTYVDHGTEDAVAQRHETGQIQNGEYCSHTDGEGEGRPIEALRGEEDFSLELQGTVLRHFEGSGHLIGAFRRNGYRMSRSL